jgi:hypothetical protein
LLVRIYSLASNVLSSFSKNRSRFEGKGNKPLRHVVHAKPLLYNSRLFQFLELILMMRGPPHYDAPAPEPCFNGCTFFKCSQGHFSVRENTGWCRLVDDKCTPETCKFTQCLKGKLLPNGTCAFTVKTKTVAVRPREELRPIRAPPKLAAKIKERELF